MVAEGYSIKSNLRKEGGRKGMRKEGNKEKSGSQFEGTVYHHGEGMASIVRGSWRQLMTLYLLFRSRVMDVDAQPFLFLFSLGPPAYGIVPIVPFRVVLPTSMTPI